MQQGYDAARLGVGSYFSVGAAIVYLYHAKSSLPRCDFNRGLRN